MAKQNKYQKVSPQTQEEAIKMAKATQKPGQTKEQTKLIAQGIEKGISHYKKQQKEKLRTLNRKLNKASHAIIVEKDSNDERIEDVGNKGSVLPWVLLLTSWLGFVAYFFTVSVAK